MGLRNIAHRARVAGRTLARLETANRSRLLLDLAKQLRNPSVRQGVFVSNRSDLDQAHGMLEQGELNPAAMARLELSDAKLDTLANGLEDLAAQPECIGAVSLRRLLDDGLVLSRETCPLGLLGVVFEARPDAVPQIVGLAIKSGNAVLLKGGREAAESNRALVDVIHTVLARHGADPAAVTLLEDREDVRAMLTLTGDVDLIVARGSSEFIAWVRSNSDIPVMGHGAGVCHVYVHEDADPKMAAAIVVDGKCSYPAACNATEAVLWDRSAGTALDAVVMALEERGVEIRGCAVTRERHPRILAANESDWGSEFGAPIIAVRAVTGMDQALEYIQRYGSKHTESIVTDDRDAAEAFLAAVDAAGVFHNASTRFADGYRYGLGAEVGISTGKLHARGPVGVEGLVTYRWVLRGSGQCSADYGPGKRDFRHEDMGT